MISSKMQTSKEDETVFDTFEIDKQIFKNGEYIQKILPKKGESEEVKNKFKLLPGLTQEELKKKEPNSDFPKYFAKIDTKNFKYIGVLTNQLKRELYGCSLMENNDEFLGQYKNEIRDGFGIYKFAPNSEEQEIYIGDYKNNGKTGKGLYLKINKSVKDDSSGDLILIDFNCGMGEFEDDIFKNGKIFSVFNDEETLYQGKINEIGSPTDENAIIIEGGNKIFMGKVSDGEIVEGRNIFVDEKFQKLRAYYITKSDNKESPYTFDFNKNEDKDESGIKKIKDSSVKAYKNQIQNIFKDVISAFDKFKNFDTAIAVNFEEEIKNKIKNNIDKLIED